MTAPKTFPQSALIPWDMARFRADAELPCGSPHPFRGLLVTIVEMTGPQPGLEDCQVMVHAKPAEIAERMDGPAVAWTAEDVSTTFPKRIFGAELANLELANMQGLEDDEALRAHLDRNRLRGASC